MADAVETSAPSIPAGGFLKDQRGNDSSKRLAAAFALVNFAGMAWAALLTGRQPAMEIMVMLISFAALSIGLTLPEWFAKTLPGQKP